MKTQIPQTRAPHKSHQSHRSPASHPPPPKLPAPCSLLFAPSRLLPAPRSPAPSPFSLLPSPARSPVVSRFSLRRDLGFWQLTFEGQFAIIKHERGILFVAYEPPLSVIWSL
jgi:hypothetical protein